MGKSAGDKEVRFLGVVYFARKKLKRWEYYSIYHLYTECSDSEIEVAMVERVPEVRYYYSYEKGGSEGLSLNAPIGSDNWV